MYKTIWKTFNRSVCALNYFNKRNILYYRSTGFRFGNFIICGFCISEIKDGDYVIIEFFSASTVGQNSTLKFTAENLRDRLAGNQRELSGINLLSITGREFDRVPPVAGICRSEPDIGTPVAILACSTRTDHPYLKSGMVSSNMYVRGQKMILIESSFEKGNCGAPVINAESGKLIGILADGLVTSSINYKSLKPIIDENINRLEKASGKWAIGDIDPAQVLAANQYMIKHLAKEFCLTTHYCSGLAVPVLRMMRFLESRDHNELFEFILHP
jgi:hypothetical protein